MLDDASPPRTRKDTAKKLLDAAAQEFNQHGFQGTDSNRIARRAGFAPQTFYRWYEDKTDIFIKVYEQWQGEEVTVLRRLLAEDAPVERLVEACVNHHRSHLLFRRSLRQLALEDARVRTARAQSRLRQIQFLGEWQGGRAHPERLAAVLLLLERLSDALAEGELEDMGLETGPAKALLGELIDGLRGRRSTFALAPDDVQDRAAAPLSAGWTQGPD